MSDKPIVPRNWQTTNAMTAAGKPILVIRKRTLGKQIPAKTKKRPITLPKAPER